MKASAGLNRALFTRITVVFALLVALNSALNLSGPAGIAVSLGVSLLLQVIYIGMVTTMVVLPGKAEGAGQLWTATRPVLSTTIWTALVFFLSVLVGMTLLILPGLFVATIWFVAIQAAVAERLSVFAALRRSQELVKGNFWRVLGVMLLVILLSLLVYVLALLVTSPLGAGLLGTVTASFLGALVAYPVGALAPACVYRVLARPPAEEAA